MPFRAPIWPPALKRSCDDSHCGALAQGAVGETTVIAERVVRSPAVMRVSGNENNRIRFRTSVDPANRNLRTLDEVHSIRFLLAHGLVCRATERAR